MQSLSARASFRLVRRLCAVVAAAITLAVGATAHADDRPLDQIFRFEHDVPVGEGRTLHVTETFSLRAFLRDGPARALVMLAGPVAPGSFYNIDVPGYDGGAIMAGHGFFTYAVDFEGTGLSTYPADGTSVTLASQVAAVDRVVRFVRELRGVPRVDLYGESWGGGVAAEVCRPEHGARSCILASMIYKTPSPLAAAQFQSPGWLAFLDSLPNAYLPTSAPLYAPLVAGSSPEVQTWVDANLPGTYTIQPFFDFFNLPFFDPGEARVPGLLIQGELDPQSLPSDIEALAAAYGKHGAVGLVTIPGAGHIPRIEPAPHSTQFWDAVTSFVDRDDDEQ
jgi:pimeloyl-ACP methyl ester carboxylesterase